MLSRANSDTPLRRAKSTSSAKRGRTIPFDSSPIDLEGVHRHAITAAHVAMSRASGHQSKDISRSDSTTSKQNMRSTPSAFQPHGDSRLRRYSSTMHTKSNGFTSTMTTPKRLDHDPTVSMIEPLDDAFDPQCSYGSAPSSYKRLRKARSALTPQNHSQSWMQPSPRSIGSRMTLRSEHRNVLESGHGFKLGLKRSLSLLKTRKRGLSVSRKRSRTQTTSTDEAIQLAREQFLQDAEQQMLLPKQSSPSLSLKPKREPKVFRRTVRSNRTTNFGDAVASENQHFDDVKPTGGRVRDFSRGLRDKMNRLFGRTSSNNEDLPIQHVDASRAYFGDGNQDASDLADSARKDPYHRDSIYIPSSQTHLVDSELIPRPSSLRSNRSTESLTDYSKSRVTSWANSTVANSVANRLPVERKRLSIIQEAGGPHQPSSSAGMHEYGIPAFQSPLYPTNTSRTFHHPVDSERVYSALLKRLDEVESDADNQKSEQVKPTVPDRRYHGTGYLNSTALAHVRASRTIRTVPSSGSFHSSSAEVNFAEHKPSESQQSLPLRDVSNTPTPTFLSADENSRQQSEPLPRDATTTYFTPSSSRKLDLSSVPCQPSKSLAINDEDGDSSSVVVSREYANASVTSMSAYSRTTSGNTPAPVRSSELLADRRRGITDDLRNYWLDRQRSPENCKPTATTKNLNGHHYRESAQISDDDTAVGGSGVSGTRQGQGQGLRYILSPPSSPSKSPRPMLPRYPLLELKQPTSRQESPPVEDFVGARSAWSGAARKDSGATMQINDENARIVLPKRSKDGMGGRAWLKGRKMGKGGDENYGGERAGLEADDEREITALPFIKGSGTSNRDANANESGDDTDNDSDKENRLGKRHNRTRGLGTNAIANDSSNSSFAKGPVLSRNRRLVSDFLRSRRRRGIVLGRDSSGESTLERESGEGVGVGVADRAGEVEAGAEAEGGAAFI